MPDPNSWFAQDLGPDPRLPLGRRAGAAISTKGVVVGSEPAFTAQIESRNGVARVALSGELDMTTSPILRECLAPLESDGVAAIMLDLRDLRFIDSTGLRVLLQANQHAETNGHRLLLVGARPGARRLFELTGTQFLIDEQVAVGVLHRFAGNGHKPNPEAGSDPRPE